jgi:hypothetical protein
MIDEIWVEHRKSDESLKDSDNSQRIFNENFRSLLDFPDHSDIIFRVGDPYEEIFAHKAILCARSEVN